MPNPLTPPPGDGPIADLLDRVRTGDRAADDEFVRRYEPLLRPTILRRAAELRLTGRVDPTDISNRVLVKFLRKVRQAPDGQLRFDTPAALKAYLCKAATNEVTSLSRRIGREQQADDSVVFNGLAASFTTPSKDAARRELVAEVTRRITPEERALVELVGLRLEWTEIAAELGKDGRPKTPEGVRQQYARLVKRLSEELDLPVLERGRKLTRKKSSRGEGK